MKKNILVVDDSALMRRVICDIIDSDSRFQVVDRAVNGKEALLLLTRKKYDAVVLDVNMPVMNGLELLAELQKCKIPAKVMMASTDTMEGAKTTLDALDRGALDFVHKPQDAFDCREDGFKTKLLATLWTVAEAKEPVFAPDRSEERAQSVRKVTEIVRKKGPMGGSKIVAIASSTGGPKALQSVIPCLPAGLDAPVVLVQHMPTGFTKLLADRMNTLSEVTVTEAAEGDVLEKGHVYIAAGGKHMNVVNGKIHYTDEPSREGVKPCANYMYESLRDSSYSQVVCVVMTGMGADGTEGVKHLKQQKPVFVIAQKEETCAVYGMPKSIVNNGLADTIQPLDALAQEIIMNVGVK